MGHLCPKQADTENAGSRRRLAVCAALTSALALSLAACDSRESGDASAGDAYDVTKMDFKSPPAVLSNERHTGAFAAGDALNMDAALKPLTASPVKEIRLDTTHKIIEIAPGVKFGAWTFGDQVPGPAVRAKVGDRIKFTMTNRSDEPVPGVRVTTASGWTATRTTSSAACRRCCSARRAARSSNSIFPRPAAT